MSPKLPPVEQYYCWKEYLLDAGGKQRLLDPWVDQGEPEFPMNWYFKSVEEAMEMKESLAPDEKWVLVKLTMEPVEWVGDDPSLPNQGFPPRGKE